MIERVLLLKEVHEVEGSSFGGGLCLGYPRHTSYFLFIPRRQPKRVQMTNKRLKWSKFELDMLYSKAFLDINKPASVILLYTLQQLEWHNTAKKSQKKRWICTNADQLKLLYSTFQNEPFKFHISTISRAIDSLLAHGFIMVKEQGGNCKGHISTYKYVEDWRRWKNGDAPIYTKTPYRNRGWTDKTGENKLAGGE